jgi:hypothetical protein
MPDHKIKRWTDANTISIFNEQVLCNWQVWSWTQEFIQCAVFSSNLTILDLYNFKAAVLLNSPYFK